MDKARRNNATEGINNWVTLERNSYPWWPDVRAPTIG
jgi:hypothetical protein